jgi:hypothetical protein
MSITAHQDVRQCRDGQVREERCYEPVAHYLIRQLMLPKIYFGRVWPPNKRSCTDVIAIDRAGTGDVHVVEVKRTLRDALTQGVRSVSRLPAHYRWVAYQGEGLLPTDDSAETQLLSESPLLPESGMGRVGVIEVVRMPFGDLGARVRVKAERFQSGDLDPAVSRFQKCEHPDIEFKE